MGRPQPRKQTAEKPIALVVEDDALQRESFVTLLEESEMDVISCESVYVVLNDGKSASSRICCN